MGASWSEINKSFMQCNVSTLALVRCRFAVELKTDTRTRQMFSTWVQYLMSSLPTATLQARCSSAYQTGYHTMLTITNDLDQSYA